VTCDNKSAAGMTKPRLAALVSLAMLAFAGNSLLCRAALKHTGVDAASFTSIRLVSGALMLWLVAWLIRRASTSAAASALIETTVETTVETTGKAANANGGTWLSAFALFVYAAGFSFAYLAMSAATGALLLFGAVQATMIGVGLIKGERLAWWQVAGFAMALAGLGLLLLPGFAAPSLLSALSMLSAGIAWGVYSLRGRGAGDPTQITAGNFLRAVPIALVFTLIFALLTSRSLSVDPAGIGYAVLSGAITSGLGYAVWYQALPALKATVAASVQLSVPVITAAGGVVFLGEIVSWQIVVASLAILGGIALVIANKK
jgi:drug/metabolite transporter (DMT)-like permease